MTQDGRSPAPPAPCRVGEPLRIYEVDDGASHWVLAWNEADALEVWREELAKLGIPDSDLDLDEPPSVEVVSLEAAGRLKFFEDDPSRPVGTMLSELERDSSRRYVGGSEF